LLQDVDFYTRAPPSNLIDGVAVFVNRGIKGKQTGKPRIVPVPERLPDLGTISRCSSFGVCLPSGACGDRRSAEKEDEQQEGNSNCVAADSAFRFLRHRRGYV